MNNKGRAGCGCLLVILVIFMVLIGVSMHPFTLRIIGKQFRYEDKVFKSDVIFVPRFHEDKNGEVYIDAFREYWAGNGSIITIEEDNIMGIGMLEIVTRLANARGIKADAIKKMDIKGDAVEKPDRVREALIKSGAKKVIILVPEYASRRFHLLYGSLKDKEGIVFIIKPVVVSYFKMDGWWRTSSSRIILFREVCSLCSFYFNRFKYGDNRKG